MKGRGKWGKRTDQQRRRRAGRWRWTLGDWSPNHLEVLSLDDLEVFEEHLQTKKTTVRKWAVGGLGEGEEEEESKKDEETNGVFEFRLDPGAQDLHKGRTRRQ